MNLPVVTEPLERLALVFSTLDSLPRHTSDPKDLLLAADEAEFYGKELGGLAGRLREAAQAVGLLQAI